MSSDGRNAIEIHRQRVGLVSRAGIRKVNTVEKDHRLVKMNLPLRRCRPVLPSLRVRGYRPRA